jgi:hypothetical protein
MPAAAAVPPPVFNAPVAPASKPPPASCAAGPIRTKRVSTQARMRTGPMTPALKARILANMAKPHATTQVTIPPIEAKFVGPAEHAEPILNTLISTPLGELQPHLSSQSLGNYTSDGTSGTSMSPDVFNIGTGDVLNPQSLDNDFSDSFSFTSTLPDAFDFGVGNTLSFEPPESDFSDSISYTSTLPDVFDVEMDDSAPLATGPWMVIDHFTGEVIVDEEVPPTVPGAPSDLVIQVEVVPALGTLALVQTSPPTLLFADQDERPDWLIESARKHLQYMPYYMCLSDVVDLFFTQEARLGYPNKVSNMYSTMSLLINNSFNYQSTRLALPSGNRPSEVAVFMKYGRDFTRGDNVDADKFGRKVVQWWLTIQPTGRKMWPPTYEPLPEDFSFKYFDCGGPNGVFLVVLCLSWWANALTIDTDNIDFGLVVRDVRWVLEQVASRA